MEQIYDMIVIGGGPAGYTAALYAARAGLSTLVLEKLTAGGQMALTERIDNYPGFAEGIDGFTLGERMQQGAERFGAVTEYAEVYAARLSERVKTLETDAGVFRGRTVVIAAGASPRTLGVPGEDALVGRGVHYCAACDGAFYQGKTVAVVGGGNSAAADALTLSRIAQKVYLIHRRDSLRATKVYHQPLLDAPNVELCWNSTVAALLHGTSRRTNPPAPISPAYSPPATCAPRRCGRWSPPQPTVQWPPTTRRNIWRRAGKSAPTQMRISGSPHRNRLHPMRRAALFYGIAQPLSLASAVSISACSASI